MPARASCVTDWSITWTPRARDSFAATSGFDLSEHYVGGEKITVRVLSGCCDSCVEEREELRERENCYCREGAGARRRRNGAFFIFHGATARSRSEEIKKDVVALFSVCSASSRLRGKEGLPSSQRSLSLT